MSSNYFSYEAVPGHPVRQVARRNLDYRNRVGRLRAPSAERLASVLGTNALARASKTDFSFLIGVLNAIAFEVIAVTAIFLIWRPWGA
jgi:hypothetical protein